ncbi:MAG: hypothetical protein WD645_04360 [Dehalococcoidia bacterium]
MTTWNGSAIPSSLAALFDDIGAHGPAGGRKRWGLGWLVHYAKEVRRRRRFMAAYGWTVPTPAAISAAGDFVGDRQLLEIGAGNGLWAYLLSAYGVAVTATDDHSWAAPPPGVKTKPPSGFPVQPGRFYPVEQLDAQEAVQKYQAHHALLLCWPPYGKSMAFRALSAFQGDRMVYIGDKGCTADDVFHAELQQRWQQQDIIHVPTWPGIHDAVYLYERKVENWQPRRTDRRRNPHLSSSG